MTSHGTDDALLRAAARRMAWQIAAVSAVVVLLAALATLALGPLLHHAHSGRPPGPDRDDEVLQTTLFVIGAVGVVISGVVGFLVAKRAVVPLGEALALQRRFVADAGHELRTPLTALHVRAQLLDRRIGPDDAARPVVEQLMADSRVLGEIVEELLASAQLGNDPGLGELFDGSEVVDEVVAEMSVLGERAGVTVDRIDAAGPASIRGSRTAVRRAVTALVDNAIGHTPAGGHVRVGMTRDRAEVAIAVVDDGEGLGGQDPEELTSRFARGAAGIRTSGGRRFGLGLSLTREVAESHGGRLTLRDATGGGVSAVLTFPLATGPSEDPTPEKPAAS